ncbi:condensation domain-containing protein, partial [Streptomyces noursei]|uniref:condensation domain-containing protein n=1 Tax=Streptomyces noursei TaxID=1971 RepID=UPI001E302D9F
MAGREPELAAVPVSFRRWARYLTGEARTRAGELELWRKIRDTPDPLLGGRPLDVAVDTAATAGQLQLTLPAELTSVLLGGVPAAFHGEINDVLLAALARAVQRWRGSSGPVLVDVEGHGRQELSAAGLDVSRTVGWFTSIHPVRLEPGQTDMVAAVKRVKEQLWAIPDKGIGYGMLRYLNPDTAAELSGPDPQIGFNYLGRFRTEADAAAGLASGRDAGMPLAHVVEVNALAEEAGAGTELRAVWSWAGKLLSEDQVRDLAQAWFAELTNITHAVRTHNAGGHTPSDFPLVTLNQADVDVLEAEYAVDGGGLAEVLPLSPLQDGLAFHADYSDGHRDVYTAQFILELTGPLDTDRLHAAAQALLDRHANLRAAFRQSPDGVSYQVIPNRTETPFTTVD